MGRSGKRMDYEVTERGRIQNRRTRRMKTKGSHTISGNYNDDYAPPRVVGCSVGVV